MRKKTLQRIEYLEKHIELLEEALRDVVEDRLSEPGGAVSQKEVERVMGKIWKHRGRRERELNPYMV